ncbi:hypothetical protein D1007_36443 [Hordeum vulgare]|nr:hypothetical protein D1007_36443 [Hordeum vulgare]
MIKQLSAVPQWIEEFKREVTRMGANMALARAKDYVPELDLEATTGGVPELKADDSVFLKQDFTKVVKETQPLATLLIDELDMNKYQCAYSMENWRLNPPKDQPFELIPPRH